MCKHFMKDNKFVEVSSRLEMSLEDDLNDKRSVNNTFGIVNISGPPNTQA